MGKAAERRNERRHSYLSQLANDKPERFAYEWEKRLSSWMFEIRHTLREENGKGQSVFRIVDHAIFVLSGCGEAAVNNYGKTTRDLLENTCCRELAAYFDVRLYQVTQRLKPKGYADKL